MLRTPAVNQRTPAGDSIPKLRANSDYCSKPTTLSIVRLNQRTPICFFRQIPSVLESWNLDLRLHPRYHPSRRGNQMILVGIMVFARMLPTWIKLNACCVEKNLVGVNRMKQHISHKFGNVALCPKSTKEDQLRCRDAINEGKLKKKNKQEYDEAFRSGVRFGSNESTIDVDEIKNSLGSMKAPNVIGPMDNFANKLNPEEALKSGKGKKVDLNDNAIRKERASIVKSYIGRWAFECVISFNAFEKDSFKMMVEVIGQYGIGLPNITRYELSNIILNNEVDRTKTLVKMNADEWKQYGCSIMADAWSDRKGRSIMNLCVNSKMGTVFLSSKECSSEAHTSQHIYEYVEACIQEVGPEHVIQVVIDNALNNMAVAKLLKQKRPRIIWTSCAAHTINLMLEGIGGLPRFKKRLDQGKKLTIFIYAHHKTLDMMRKFTDNKEIVRPGVTRFSSSYLTLESLSEKK